MSTGEVRPEKQQQGILLTENSTRSYINKLYT